MLSDKGVYEIAAPPNMLSKFGGAFNNYPKFANLIIIVNLL